MQRCNFWFILAGITSFWLFAGATRADAPKAEPGKRPRLVAQLGHSDRVKSVAFSPDGKQVLTGSWDLTAQLWDVQSGKVLRAFTGLGGLVSSVAFSPDGKQVLTGNERAALLWDAQSGKALRAFTGHTDSVKSVAFSPDGKQVLTGSDDKTARLCDAQSGKVLRTFTGHSDRVESVAFSPDGKQVLTGSRDSKARLWDVQSGKALRTFTGHSGLVSSVAFSPDGKQVLTGSLDTTAQLWDVQSGKVLRAFTGHARMVDSVEFSPDGKLVLTGSEDRTAQLWDVQSGKVLRAFKHPGSVDSVAFSPDGKQILTGCVDSKARLWDARTGKELRLFRGTSDLINSVGFPVVDSVAFSPDGNRVLTRSGKTAQLWDAQSGKVLLTIPQPDDPVSSVASSPDGKQVLTGSRDSKARLWDVQSGKALRTFTGHSGLVSSVAFSPDGKQVLTGSLQGTAQLWDVQSGKVLRAFTGHTGAITFVMFSPDGKQVLTDRGTTAQLWDTQSGKELRMLRAPPSEVFRSVAFSPDGKQVLIGSSDETARLWDAQSAKVLQIFKGHINEVLSVAFAPDGKQVLTGDMDNTVRLWDAQTGKELRTFRGSSDVAISMAFSPDGKRVLTGGFDCTTLIWEAQTGRELCSLISFADGTWAVGDSDGRFDAANGGDVKGLHWVVGNEPIDLAQLKERYYDPGLLAKKLGFNKEPLRKVEAFTNPKLYPEVQVAEPTPDKQRLGITLTNRGGGIGRVVVRINGKELTADARPRGANPDADKLRLEVDLANDPRLKPGENNVIEVEAFNAEGYLRSRGLQRIFKPEGKVQAAPPELWAVVVGVSHYRGGAIDLRYAAKDAEDFAKALQVVAGRLFGVEKVHLQLLTTTMKDTAAQPTRENLVRALDATRKAKPTDILVIYLAGHGVNYGGQDGDFYFLTSEARSAELTDPEVRKQAALSSQELTELFKHIPALKQVMILDTCASGKALEKLTEKRDVPSSQIRALERVKDRTGLHILAGCAADAVSYEASRYAQGVLTYSLLLGMRGAKLRDGQFVDVVDLFGFASDKVPELARDIGGIQRPVIASPRGASFDIGRVTPEDQAKIPLQAVRPLVLRASFQEEEQFDDMLGLGKQVDEILRSVSARGRDSRLVFVDARELPDAYRLAGRYRIEEGKVTVTINLFQGRKRIGQFTVSGEKAKVAELVSKIIGQMEKRLSTSMR